MTFADTKGCAPGCAPGWSWRYRALTAVVMLAVACTPESTVAPRDPAELRVAPTTVVVGGTALSLDADLWRDFQPISPPNGKPLVGIVRIRSVDGASVPSSTRVVGLWVVNGDNVWTSVPREEQQRTPGAKEFDVVARDGPKWGPGVDVDVIVGVRDGAGAVALLRAPAQRIKRTD